MRNFLTEIILPYLCLLTLAVISQTTFLINPDIAFLLKATQEMLAGGQYGKEIFEMNPPLILWLYSPVICLEKLSSLNILLIFSGYIFLLITIVLGLCYRLLKGIVQNNFVFLGFFYALMLVLFFLPAGELGQREHLTLIFIMPYLFSAVLALENKKISKKMKLIIGILAGVGFAIKPLFLIPLVLIESYFILMRRNFLGWIRIESVVILSFMCVYLGIVFLFYSNFIHIVLPLISHYYFFGYSGNLFTAFSSDVLYFCLLSILVCMIFYSQDQYRYLSVILALAIFGFVIAFMLPNTAWYYHFIPAIGLSCLLMANYLLQLIYIRWKSPNVTLAKCNHSILISILFLIFFISYFYVVPWWIISMVVALLIVITTIAMKQKSSVYTRVINDSWILFLGFLIYFTPLKVWQISLESTWSQRIVPSKLLMNYLNSARDKGEFYVCIGMYDACCFYPEYHVGGKIHGLWWLPGLLKTSPSMQTEKDKEFLIGLIAEDLQRSQNKYAFVNTKGLPTIYPDFDILEFFSQNPQFRKAWQDYRFVTHVGYYKIYERK